MKITASTIKCLICLKCEMKQFEIKDCLSQTSVQKFEINTGVASSAYCISKTRREKQNSCNKDDSNVTMYSPFAWKNKWFGYNETMRGPELFLHALDPILPSTEVPRLVHPNGVGLLSFFFFKSVTSQRFYTDPEEPSWIHALYIIEKNGDDMKPLLRGKAHEDSRFYAKSNAWIKSFGLKIRKIETI